jgi:hypothetical protein
VVFTPARDEHAASRLVADGQIAGLGAERREEHADRPCTKRVCCHCGGGGPTVLRPTLGVATAAAVLADDRGRLGGGHHRRVHLQVEAAGLGRASEPLVDV